MEWSEVKSIHCRYLSHSNGRLQRKSQLKIKSLGENAINQGKVGAVIMSGGQGTRLA